MRAGLASPEEVLMTEATEADQRPALKEIQGNLVGFNKDFQRLLFLTFADAPTGKAFLAAIEPYIASASEVRLFNQLYKEIQARKGQVRGAVESTWVNIALTSAGLEAIGADVSAFPDSFRQGMAARAGVIGDAGPSAPQNWTAPFTGGARVHAVLILASDTEQDLDAGTAWVRAVMAEHGVAEAGAQDGQVRPDPNRGREHFGFKDGISQPFIPGLTAGSNKKGNDAIAMGEFLIGYRDEDGHVSGKPPPAAQPGQPGYNPTPPPPSPALPEWATNGSYLVYRRLRQDVAAFQQFVNDQAQPLGLPPDAVGAKLVGRWASGAPLETVQGEKEERDPAAGDPGADPNSPLLREDRINRFDYQQHDADGHLVPRAAHIRKTNPRDEDPPGRPEANRHRLLRRGIPYGPEFQPTEPAYPGAGAVPDNQDRGLVFICYQASVDDGFEFVQQGWANTADFPQAADGRDPIIISQDVNPRDMTLPPHGSIPMAQWVTSTGGDYFFAPSLGALRSLSQP
jgi:Dyp-type peroxidase family